MSRWRRAAAAPGRTAVLAMTWVRLLAKRHLWCIHHPEAQISIRPRAEQCGYISAGMGWAIWFGLVLLVSAVRCPPFLAS